MNLRIFPVITLVAALLLTPLESHAQSLDAKLAVLEKLPAAERQQKLLEGAKAEVKRSFTPTWMSAP